MSPELVACRAERVTASFEISGNTRQVHLDGAGWVFTDLALDGDVMADVTHFDEVLVNQTHVLLHLDNAASAQCVYTLFLI